MCLVFAPVGYELPGAAITRVFRCNVCAGKEYFGAFMGFNKHSHTKEMSILMNKFFNPTITF